MSGDDLDAELARAKSAYERALRRVQERDEILRAQPSPPRPPVVRSPEWHARQREIEDTRLALVAKIEREEAVAKAAEEEREHAKKQRENEARRRKREWDKQRRKTQAPRKEAGSAREGKYVTKRAAEEQAEIDRSIAAHEASKAAREAEERAVAERMAALIRPRRSDPTRVPLSSVREGRYTHWPRWVRREDRSGRRWPCVYFSRTKAGNRAIYVTTVTDDVDADLVRAVHAFKVPGFELRRAYTPRGPSVSRVTPIPVRPVPSHWLFL